LIDGEEKRRGRGPQKKFMIPSKRILGVGNRRKKKIEKVLICLGGGGKKKGGKGGENKYPYPAAHTFVLFLSTSTKGRQMGVVKNRGSTTPRGGGGKKGKKRGRTPNYSCRSTTIWICPKWGKKEGGSRSYLPRTEEKGKKADTPPIFLIHTKKKGGIEGELLIFNRGRKKKGEKKGKRHLTAEIHLHYPVYPVERGTEMSEKRG